MPTETMNDVDCAAHALGVYISDISEEWWCAGWLHDIEHDVWEWAHHPETNTRLPDEQIATLLWFERQLHGGWVGYNPWATGVNRYAKAGWDIEHNRWLDERTARLAGVAP